MLSGLMIHAGEEQERGRGAQKRSRDAEQGPANCSRITSIIGIEGKGGDAGSGGGNAPIEWKPPQLQERKRQEPKEYIPKIAVPER